MISLDWTLFVQMAIFLAFTFYVNAFLLQPMARYLARRKDTIEGTRERGGEQDVRLETLQKDYHGKISGAREDMLTQRTTARKEAMAIQSSILDEAKKEAHQELYKAEAELQKDIAAARDTLQKEARALASSMTEKILGRACQ